MEPRTITRTIARMERKPNSTNGNPRFEVVFTDGTSAVTGADCQVGYDLQNHLTFRDGIEVVFELNGRDQIIGATPVAK